VSGPSSRAGAVLAAWLCLAAVSPAQTGGGDWRALALASFDTTWTVVNDTFYDAAFGGVNWVATRDELRPKVEAAATPEAARQVLREMIARLKTSHFVIISNAPGEDTLPGDATVAADVRILPAGAVVTHVEAGSTAEHAGLRAGDRVVAIDGRPVAAWIAAAEGPDDRAKRFDAWKRIFRALHGGDRSTAHLTVETARGQKKELAVTRARDTGDMVMLGNLPPIHVRTTVTAMRTPRGRRVGAIAFNYWMATVAEPFAAGVDRFRSADAIVIDLRGNTGGLADMIRGLAGHFLAEPALLGRMHMRAADLEFRANPRRSTADGRRVEPFAGPVAILVDDLTGSASECFAGGLQSLGRVRVFGVPTMGQALPAATQQLPDGDVLLHAVGDFVTSTGQRLEGAGVQPDEVAPVTVAALAAGHDPAMDAALAWVDRRAGR